MKTIRMILILSALSFVACNGGNGYKDENEERYGDTAAISPTTPTYTTTPADTMPADHTRTYPDTVR